MADMDGLIDNINGMKIKVNKHKDKAKCWTCGNYIEMVLNTDTGVNEITCCGKTISIYPNNFVLKPKKKRKYTKRKK
jgi:hypothetical protein